MKFTWGWDFFELRGGRRLPVVFDSSRLINGHVLLVGASGMGKSHTIRRMVCEGRASAPHARFHVFDVHGDLDIPEASTVRFSEQAPFGLNPLKVNPSPDFGGVRRAIQTFIRVVNQSSQTALGVKQESVIRNILLDVYRDFGFDSEAPKTWSVNEYDRHVVGGLTDNRLYLEVPFSDKAEASALGARWDNHVRHWYVHTEKYAGALKKWPPAFKPRRYPTVADAASYAKRLYEERYLGTDQKAVQALAQLNKAARAYQKRLIEAMKDKNLGFQDDEAELALKEAGHKAKEAFEHYVDAVKTGYELESLIKYDNPTVLKSVLDRLANIRATGLFKDTPPPFDPQASVWRYQLDALSHEEKKMMVFFLMQEIFNAAVQRGSSNDLVEVIVLDELGTYTSTQDENGDGIIGIIAREARKFGVGLWAANQSPMGIPESLVSSAGTKVILGIDERYWRSSVDKLRVELNLLSWIQPRAGIAVQMKEIGVAKTRWWWTSLESSSRQNTL